MKAWILLAMALVLGGCASTPGTGGPYNGGRGIPLAEYMGEGTHGRGSGSFLAPNTTAASTAPANCTAYSDGVAKSGDRCTIQGPVDTGLYGGPGPASWSIHAFWTTGPRTRAVAAFSASGAQVAWWDGSSFPSKAYITE
jgi:hypothetical protein